MRWLFAALLLPSLAIAQDKERDRLLSERQTLLDRYAVEERACRERFVVTACMDELRVRRRVALEPLRERELALDDAERRQRASDRQAVRPVRPQPASAATLKAPAEADAETAAARAAPPVSVTVREPGAPRIGDGSTSRALQAAERARAAAKRAEMLNATQAEVARNGAERASSGKPALALPVPQSVGAGASAPARRKAP